MARPYIWARDLEITYNLGKSNEFKALQGADAEIYKGEYIILFGPSGSGKSTLMYAVMGSLPPSGGSLLIGGDDIYAYSSEDRVFYQRNVMGIIYQQFNLIQSLTVRDNVALPQIFAGVDKKTRDRRAQAILERFGVGHVGDKIPAMLSGGQQQRVSVSRSMVNDPEILLADEPTGNLDSISTQQVMDKVREINHEGKTIMMVSHNAAHLPEAHRVFYIRDGRIIRIVVNPQRKQIKKVEEGETLVTELEQLARLWPYDSLDTLRVKSIVNYVTQDYNFDQIIRLERFIQQTVNGGMSSDKLVHLLSKSFADGGVGMTKQEATHMARKVKNLLTESRNVKRFRDNRHYDLAFIYQHKFLLRIEEHLLKEYKQKLTPNQKKNMQEIILDRLSGATRKNDLVEQLNAKVSLGGAGLHIKTAFKIASYFEKILAQGISFEHVGGE
jgi:putative ABC transport system ATP-binding protein